MVSTLTIRHHRRTDAFFFSSSLRLEKECPPNPTSTPSFLSFTMLSPSLPSLSTRVALGAIFQSRLLCNEGARMPRKDLLHPRLLQQQQRQREGKRGQEPRRRRRPAPGMQARHRRVAFRHPNRGRHRPRPRKRVAETMAAAGVMIGLRMMIGVVQVLNPQL